ncbi:outer membrane receptor for ferrienterochelin and colicin [Neolewinella xylanilytica]|uniref:Outer membrane receptor for ferrienterochelin and colicin n=1 Tax=Neolewinella xylanilytica TaxID=1514080 RepID=A0A2S6I852_9BACT|nr:TonB-dependent receptor [Neolewinella xylanilytica]PPK87677.1 outer membrane receptor for ferrienterochelin and colicin [Neolewinella xylanilytica]
MLRTILFLLATLPLAAQTSVTLSGTVTDATSGEQLAGVNVYLPTTTTGVQTNGYGFYSLTLPADSRRVVFSYLGYRSDTVRIGGDPDRLDIALQPAGEQLTTVEVTARNDAAARASAGVHQLDPRAVAVNPVLLGEKDVFKALQLLPGVANPREGFGGLFVRGGTPGQNLILLDGAPVYNAFHLFGFLSVFNSDALQGVTLYKGQYPARFGGRVSSVVDLRMKEGNRKEWHGRGGIGLLSSRLTLEGPIGKSEKVSVLLSGRRTYLDLLYTALSGEKDKLYFYDGNFKVNYHLDDRQQVFVSGYLGQDRFSFQDEYGGAEQTDGFDWGNRTLTVRYNRQLGERAFLNVTGIRTAFDFTVENEEVTRDRLYRVTYRSGIRDLGLQADLDYFLSNRHTLRAGASATDHDFTLITSAEVTDMEGGRADGADTVRALELTAYLEDEFTVSPRLTANYGLRFTRFTPRSGRSYAAAEPRLNLTYRLDDAWTATAGYAYTRQYLHLLSNSGPTLPTSLWVPASEDVRPQSGQLFSVGAAWSPDAEAWSVTGAVFYRLFNDIIGYTNGASFFLLDALNEPGQTNRIDVVDNLTSGHARAGGFELGGTYTGSRLRASLAYTLSRVDEQLDGVNDDDYYPAAQDRRHDLTLTARYDLRPNLLISANWTYGSGVPTSVPISEYGYNALPGFSNTGGRLADYEERNNYRMTAVHRLDVALRWRRSPKWGKAVWELGLYNAYSRANPFYVTTERGFRSSGRRLVQRALFPVVPSISYNFEF